MESAVIVGIICFTAGIIIGLSIRAWIGDELERRMQDIREQAQAEVDALAADAQATGRSLLADIDRASVRLAVASDQFIEESLKDFRNRLNEMDKLMQDAYDTGREEGRAEGA
jgi:regulator of protease activity HflC (stomatin/prohibitin superfamily)